MASDRGLYQRDSLIVSTGITQLPTRDGKTVFGQIIEERVDDALVEVRSDASIRNANGPS
jgi:hypothetical protein